MNISIADVVGPIVSFFVNNFGFRAVTISGAIIACVGYFVSSFSPDLDVLIVTYGALGGNISVRVCVLCLCVCMCVFSFSVYLCLSLSFSLSLSLLSLSHSLSLSLSETHYHYELNGIIIQQDKTVFFSRIWLWSDVSSSYDHSWILL